MAAIPTTDVVNPTALIVRLQGDRVHVQNHLYASHLPSARPGRGVVEEFSRESAARLRDYLVACDAEYNVFGTVTYPYGFDGGRTPALAKNHLRALLERLRRLWGAEEFKGESICWWMEFTKRGMVHFHFLSTRYVDKKWLALSWYQVVGSEDTRHLEAGTQVDALRSRGDSIKYAAKYASKQSEVPVSDCGRIGRWWGVYGRRSVVEADLYIKGGRKGLKDEEINGLYEKIQDKLIDLCTEGQATILSSMSDEPSIVTFRVPQIGLRRMLRGFLKDLAYESRVIYYMDASDPLWWHEHEFGV